MLQYQSEALMRPQDLVRRTCDPRIVERTLVDNVNLRESIQELLDSQETAHNTLGIAETSLTD